MNDKKPRSLLEAITQLTNKNEKKANGFCEKLHTAYNCDTETHAQEITMKDIRKAKRQLKGMVVSVLDKANASLIVM